MGRCGPCGTREHESRIGALPRGQGDHGAVSGHLSSQVEPDLLLVAQVGQHISWVARGDVVIEHHGDQQLVIDRTGVDVFGPTVIEQVDGAPSASVTPSVAGSIARSGGGGGVPWPQDASRTEPTTTATAADTTRTTPPSGPIHDGHHVGMRALCLQGAAGHTAGRQMAADSR